MYCQHQTIRQQCQLRNWMRMTGVKRKEEIIEYKKGAFINWNKLNTNIYYINVFLYQVSGSKCSLKAKQLQSDLHHICILFYVNTTLFLNSPKKLYKYGN